MDYDDAVRQLAEFQGRTVLVQLRHADADTALFSMLDGINEVSQDDEAPDRVWLNFHDAEASLSLTRENFVDAAWEGGWRTGEEHERLFRVRAGAIDIGFLET